MKEIVGYSMIEPDGSVMLKVPANTALQISVLDANGRRITTRHQNWLQLRPGQFLECNGCHVAQGGISPPRRLVPRLMPALSGHCLSAKWARQWQRYVRVSLAAIALILVHR